MSREAILHIGTQKTGSTSIQKVLNQHRDELPAQGAYYPKNPAGAHELVTYAVAEPRPATRPPESILWRGMDPEERLRQYRKELAEELSGLPPTVKRVIISDERLSFMLRSPEEIAPLKTLLAPHFTRFRVIVYIRDQVSYLASRYAETLRGSIGEPDHIRSIPAIMAAYQYDRLLQNWADVFGEEAIEVRLYERRNGKSFDSVQDFLSLCDLRIDVTADPHRTLNTSMNFGGQQLLVAMGRYMKERSPDNQLDIPMWRMIAHTVTQVLPGKGWQPTREEAAAFMQRFEQNNENVRRKYFPDRDVLFHDVLAGLPEKPMEISDKERFEAAAKVLLEAMGQLFHARKMQERRGKQPEPVPQPHAETAAG